VSAVRGLIFDVDDTLLDTAAAFAAAVAVVSQRFLPHLPPERAGEVLTAWRRDDGGHFRAYTQGHVDFAGQRRARAAALQRAFDGPALDEEAFGEWNALFEATVAASWRAHPDAGVAVATARGRGLRLGALSNSEVAYQRAKLDAAGLGHVPMLVGIDTLGRAKPDAEVFLEACRRLGTAPRETIYVGDELDVDAFAATRAGLLGVWLDRPGARRGGAFLEDEEAARAAGVPVITSLVELEVLLPPRSP
jgi:putative hydrolase of the HAD superfamily